MYHEIVFLIVAEEFQQKIPPPYWQPQFSLIVQFVILAGEEQR